MIIDIGDTVKFKQSIEYVLRDMPRDLIFTVDNIADNIAFLRNKHGFYTYAHVNVLTLEKQYEHTS